MAKSNRTLRRRSHPSKEQSEVFLRTGILGCDTILRGGLVTPPSQRGLVILIKGRPGTGKTTLALQMAMGACGWDRDEILVESYEQSAEDVAGIFKRLGVNVRRHPYNKIEIRGTGKVDHSGDKKDVPIEATPTSLAWAREIVTRFKQYDDRKCMVVVDGLNFLGVREHNMFELEIFVNALREVAKVGVIVFEPARSLFANVDFLADMVIELKGEEVEKPYKYFLNHLNITKSRFQPSVLGWHQYKIRDDGLVVFPSIHYHLHFKDLLQRRYADSLVPISKVGKKGQIKASPPLEKDSSILGKLLGPENIKQGSCTVVLGPRRTWKTLITLDFLRAGSKLKVRKQAGLLVSLLDNQSTIIEQRNSLCKGFCAQRKGGRCVGSLQYSQCYSEVYLLHFRPGCIAPGEFFHFLDRRLTDYENTGNRIRRLVFWDLTQLEYRFPLLAADAMYLPGLMDYLKNSRHVTSVFIGTSDTHFARASSAMADNVLFCWEDTLVENQKKGIAYYVDRVEGKPEKGALQFLTPDFKMEHVKKPDDLLYAFKMIEEIRNIQGLPVHLSESP